MSLQDKAVLIRHSGYAEPEPSSSTHFELPFAGVDVREENYVRDGLQYVFPFTAKRISYPYWDVVAHRATPLDYVDPVELPNGLITWKYAQNLEALPLQTDLEFHGKASQYFTAEELAARNLEANSAVTLAPFYSVTRTVQLEPKTGIMTDYSVDISVVLDIKRNDSEGNSEAGSSQPASATPAATSGQPAATSAQPTATQPVSTEARNTATPSPLPLRRTLFSGSQTWDGATQQAALDRIQPIVAQLKLFQVLSYICSILTMLLALWSAWQLIRWRRRYLRTRAATASGSSTAPTAGSDSTSTPNPDSDKHTND